MILTSNVQLELDSLELEASLTLSPEENQDLPTAEELRAHLADQHSIEGVELEALERLIQKVTQAPDREHTEVVARGQPPEPGRDGTVEWLGEFFDSQPQVQSDGTIDFYRRNKRSVEPGCIIARVVPPTDGVPGRTVRGREIPAEPGQAVHVELDDSVQWVDEDRFAVRAVHGGMVEFAQGSISICELYEVDTVDFGSGCVEFDGTVHVSGDVRELFSVVTRGSLLIDGFAESADLEAGGDLIAKGGLLGHGRGSARAAGNLTVAHARDIALACGGNLTATGELLWCTAEVVGNAVNEKGRIIGGEWHVGGSLYAQELGSPLEVATSVTMGAHPEIRRLRRVDGDLRKLYDQTMELVRRAERTAEARRKGSSWPLRHMLEALSSAIEASRGRRLALKRPHRSLGKQSAVWVQGMVHPGVSIRIHNLPRPLEAIEPIRGPVWIGARGDCDHPVVMSGEDHARWMDSLSSPRS